MRNMHFREPLLAFSSGPGLLNSHVISSSHFQLVKLLSVIASTAFIGVSLFTSKPGHARPIDWDCGSLGRITTSGFSAPNQVVYITAKRIGVLREKGVSKGGANWLSIEAPSIHLFNGSEGIFANRTAVSGRFFNGSEVSCSYN